MSWDIRNVYVFVDCNVFMSDSDSIDFSMLSEVSDELSEVFREVESSVESREKELKERKQELEEEKSLIERKLQQVSDIDVSGDELRSFIEKPYTMVPREENEAWVIVPRWVPFNVGYLERQDESYNHFVVNKYVNWISELPAEIQDSVGIEKEFDSVEVSESTLSFSSEVERDRAWDMLGGRDGGLYRRMNEDEIQIKSGKEFDVIAELIENGNLPFKPNPIDESSLRGEPKNVSLRSYQKRAWEKFSETGMVGVYWPPGAGKTFLALYAGERITGKKLVIVPQKTLEEQWTERIAEFCEYPDEWDVKTYQYLTYGDNMDEYNTSDLALTIFEECHTLPSNTYSKLATLDTEYRMGLTASPYREDNRIEYVFALTGYPVGLNWDELVDLGVTDLPTVRVYLHSTMRQKVSTAKSLASDPGKIVFFCDEIEAGKQLAEELNTEFVYGETTDRIEKFKEHRVIVSSRVGDEGLSLPSLSRVVEFSFHGSSRRQELQRAGRVMHNSAEETAGEHIVLMTDDEYEKFGSRLLSLEQKGFDIEYIRAN